MSRLHRRIVIRGGCIAIAMAVFATVSPSLSAEQKPLAIEGYDPVAYFTAGVPTPGSPDFEYEWDEHRYRFASVEHRDLFKANPARYAPQFSGFCAMALTRGQFLTVNPQYWLVSDGRLYLFSREFGPDLFKRDPEKNYTKANENLPIARN